MRVLDKIPIIIFFALLGSAACWYYLANAPPPGVEVKGSEEAALWISLATSVVSFLTALAGLVVKVLDLRAKRSSSQ